MYSKYFCFKFIKYTWSINYRNTIRRHRIHPGFLKIAALSRNTKRAIFNYYRRQKVSVDLTIVEFLSFRNTRVHIVQSGGTPLDISDTKRLQDVLRK